MELLHLMNKVNNTVNNDSVSEMDLKAVLEYE
jgi:hypothetical protein